MTIDLRIIAPTHADADAMSDERLEQIRARERAATPGPWRWTGNVDHEDPRLASPRLEVLGHVPRERTAQDRDAQACAAYLREQEIWDSGAGGLRSPTEQEIAERLRVEWLEDMHGNPRRDERMAFVDPTTHLYREARDLAVFQVCPEATSRDDDRVYRADIIGLSDPNAEFIACSRADVTALLAEVDRLRAVVYGRPAIKAGR